MKKIYIYIIAFIILIFISSIYFFNKSENDLYDVKDKNAKEKNVNEKTNNDKKEELENEKEKKEINEEKKDIENDSKKSEIEKVDDFKVIKEKIEKFRDDYEREISYMNENKIENVKMSDYVHEIYQGTLVNLDVLTLIIINEREVEEEKFKKEIDEFKQEVILIGFEEVKNKRNRKEEQYLQFTKMYELIENKIDELFEKYE